MRGEQWLLFTLTSGRLLTPPPLRLSQKSWWSMGWRSSPVKWAENWLNRYSEPVVISGMRSSNRPMVCPRGQYWVQSCSTTSLMGWWFRGYPLKICWWHKTGGSPWYTRELCCHPEGHEQAEEMGWREPCAVQQRGAQSSAAGEEWSQAWVHAGNCLESRPSRKGYWSSWCSAGAWASNVCLW